MSNRGLIPKPPRATAGVAFFHAAGALALLSACSAASGASSKADSGVSSGNGASVSSGGGGGDNGGAAGGVGEMASGGFLSVGHGTTDAAVSGGECGGQTFPLAAKPAELFLVFDRSGSMKDKPDGAKASTSKWDLTVPAVESVVTATDARVSWGLKTFPEGDTTSCVVTDQIDVPIAKMSGAMVNAALTAATPDGNGTPTGDAVKAAVKYLDSVTKAGDTSAKYILLATDGEPSCVDGAEKSQSTSTPYAVQAVADAAKAGYPTFVVGVSTTKKSATDALNAMAVAGGKARSVGADAGADGGTDTTKYYLASTQDELVAAFGAITGAVLDCRFALSSAPPDGQHVGVILGADRVPPDSWSYTDATKTTILVTGAACDTIKSGTADSVRIVFGCPTDPIR